MTKESSSSSSCASAPIMYEIDVDDKIDGSRVRTAVLHVSTRVTSKSRIPVFEYPMRLAESRSWFVDASRGSVLRIENVFVA